MEYFWGQFWSTFGDNFGVLLEYFWALLEYFTSTWHDLVTMLDPKVTDNACINRNAKKLGMLPYWSETKNNVHSLTNTKI